MINRKKLKEYGLTPKYENSGRISGRRAWYNTYSRMGYYNDKVISLEERIDGIKPDEIDDICKNSLGYKKDGKPAVLFKNKEGRVMSIINGETPKEATLEDLTLAEKQFSKRGISSHIGNITYGIMTGTLFMSSATSMMYGIYKIVSESSLQNAAIGGVAIALGAVGAFIDMALSDIRRYKDIPIGNSYFDKKEKIDELISKGKRQVGLIR